MNVGQKVTCVDASNIHYAISSAGVTLVQGAEYTIRKIRKNPAGQVAAVLLEEMVLPQDPIKNREFGWRSSRFAIVTENVEEQEVEEPANLSLLRQIAAGAPVTETFEEPTRSVPVETE